MKIRNIILISFLLAILTIGVVSAAEDVNQTASAADDNILASAEQINDDVNLTIYPDDTILKDENGCVYVDIETDRIPDGRLIMDIDGKETYNQAAERGSTEIPYSIITDALGNNFGLHNVTIGLFNDTHLKNVSKTWLMNYAYFKYDIPDEIHDSYFTANFAKGVEGTVTLTVDNKKIDTVSIEDGEAWIDIYGLKYGKHTYKLEFKSTKSTNVFKSFAHSGSFNYEYLFDVSAIRDNIFYGETANIEIYLPEDIENNIKVTYNNKSRYVKADEEGYAGIALDDLQMGENKITLSYPKDSQYPARSKEVTVTVHEKLDVTTDVGYGSGDGILLRLPEDAMGNLTVTVDGDAKSYSLNRGICKVDLSDYIMGTHSINVNYTGDDYAIGGFDGNFSVVAGFTYLQNVYYKDGINVSVSLPSDANGTLTVSYDGRYRKADVIDGTASILFDNIPVCEGLEFTFEYSNGNYADYKKQTYINSREDLPYGELFISIPETVLMGGYDVMAIYLGAYAEGYANVTVDGVYCRNTTVCENVALVELHDIIKNLKAGNHTVTVDYSGDDYYRPNSNTPSFSIDFYRIDLSQEVYVDEHDYILMHVSDDVTGPATLYIADKTVKGTYYEDEDYEAKYIQFDLSKISCGEYNAKIVFAGDKKHAKFTKEFKLNVTYDVRLDLDEDNNYYGNTTILHFTFTSDIPKVNITVGNQTFTRNVIDREVTLEVENNVVGQQKIAVTCFATAKYPQKTYNWTYNVTPKIDVPERINIIDGGNITLSLPNDAKGSLVVEVYDKGNLADNYTAEVENGSASIHVSIKKLGDYEVIAKYAGDDYDVSEIDAKLSVSPKITYPHNIYVGQDSNLTFEMPSDASGELTWAFGSSRLDVVYENGKAEVVIPHFAAIEDDFYYLYVLYEDPVYGTYFDQSFSSLDVMKYDANATPVLPKEIIANNYITLSITFPADATGYVSGDDDYVQIKNGKAILKVFVPKAGKNSIYFWYSGDSKYKDESYWVDITALPAPKLTMNPVTVYYTDSATMKVKVVDSYGKIVKGKYVTFYVNGKKVKSVKTDKKGFAAIKLTKKPGTYSVKATYKGGVVTKKLTVRHLVTLKTVKVKKSSRKLVLKVTLKKGKKALKYKRVTFKFNGKTYKVKTNKKGVAKITIKKKTLKKLKVGKKVTYQATYLKDTVKKTAKVIR